MRKSLSATLVLSWLLIAAWSTPALAQSAVRTGEIVKIDIAAKSFVVKTARGETNVMTTDKTVVKEGDKTLTFEDLKVGDSVRITGVRKNEDVEAEEVMRQPKPAKESGALLD
jgi:hypothetical protein